MGYVPKYSRDRIKERQERPNKQIDTIFSFFLLLSIFLSELLRK
ncbi:hypothetical protein LGFR6_17060 [Lactococcus garvieae]